MRPPSVSFQYGVWMGLIAWGYGRTGQPVETIARETDRDRSTIAARHRRRALRYALAVGRVKCATVPPSTERSTQILPPCASTMHFEM